MKALILRMLTGVGLAPASHVALARHRARRAADKTSRLQAHLEKLRTDRDAWKQRHRDAAATADEWRKRARGADAEAERAKAAAARASAHVDEWRTRAETLTGELRELKERLEESRRTGALAREHLMATEAKLDLIEAAIQVLDVRTREAAVPRS
jgi:chromosome segregation ATPase